MDHDITDTNNFIKIHKYFMKKTWHDEIMFGVIKRMSIVLLTSIVNASNHTKCASLTNQKCEILPTLINLYPN